MFGLSKGCRTCCRKQQNKIQPASRKSKREFFRRENTKCTFSSRRHLCFRLGRQAAQSPTLPDRQHILFRRQPAQISRLHSAAAAANPSIVKCFLQLRFSRRENTRYIFFQHPKPSLPAWPANIYRCQSYYNLQQDNSFPSGASRPTSPAALLLIPAHNPQQANSLPPGLAGRRLTFLPTTFLTATKHHLPTKYRSIPFFHSSSFFYFSIFYIAAAILPAFAFPYLQLQSHPTTFSTPSTSSVLLPLPTRRSNAKRSFARGCSLQGCRGRGRGARVSSFFFMFLFSASLFSLSFSISLAPRLRRDAFIFLFAFVFLFVFSLCFSFFLLLLLSLFFSFYFFSLFFFLFFSLCFFIFLLLLFFLFFIFVLFLFSLFAFFLLLLLSLPSLFFLFVFLLSFYLCFSFSFFCLSFCFTFLPSLLQSLSSLSNRSPTIHFFLFRRQSFPFPPATSRQQ